MQSVCARLIALIWAHPISRPCCKRKRTDNWALHLPSQLRVRNRAVTGLIYYFPVPKTPCTPVWLLRCFRNKLSVGPDVRNCKVDGAMMSSIVSKKTGVSVGVVAALFFAGVSWGQ